MSRYMAKIIYIFVNGIGTCTYFCVLNYYFLSPFLLTKAPALSFRVIQTQNEYDLWVLGMSFTS